MRMKLVALAVISLTVVVAISGCLGGGDEGEEKEEYEEFTDERNVVGQGEGLSQAQPETVTTKQAISLENEMITEVTFSIAVEDGDENTNEDNVNEITITPEEGDNGTTINGGETPFSSSATIKWDGVNYLNSTYMVTFSVQIEGSDDQPPGPGIIIWNGVPDYGFSYSIDINYTYLASKNI